MSEPRDQYEEPELHGRDAVDEGDDFNPLADLRLRRPPFWMIAGFLVLIVLSWIPLVTAARRRVSTSENPQVHLIQDMDNQPRYKAQHPSRVFADGRADRPRIIGTVSRQRLEAEDFFHRGYETKPAGGATTQPQVNFLNGFPQQVKVDMALLERGRQQFNIYCSSCHGEDGYGAGPVHLRAMEVAQSPTPMGTNWVQPASLHSDLVKNRPNGHIFNTITNGIRNMPPHGPQITVPNRWAIVAYVRALQLSQDAPADTVPPERISNLR